MFNLFEILRRAQGGSAMDNMARQFGLSSEQTNQAATALMPALSLGLQHTALLDPMGFAQMFWRAGQPPGPQMFEQPSRAFSSLGQQQGDLFLGQLFGSPQAAQQVAQQAAAMTGLGSEVMRQMLPVMAGMIVTGVLHAAMNQGSGQGLGQGPNDMLGRLSALMGAPAAPPPRSTPASTALAPWTAFMDTFFGKPAAPVPPPQPTPSPDLVGQMFQAGVQVQEQYATALRTLLDGFWNSPRGKA